MKNIFQKGFACLALTCKNEKIKYSMENEK